MKGNEKIIEHLNARLAEELTAINQYMVHSEMAANWGYKKLHESFEKRAIDEMKHAEELIGRVLFLEGIPIVSKLGPMSIGADVPKQLAGDHGLEATAIKAYNSAIILAGEARDYATREILEKFSADKNVFRQRFCKEMLKLLGMHFPERPTSLQVLFALLQMKRLLRGRSYDSFLELPETAARALAAVRANAGRIRFAPIHEATLEDWEFNIANELTIVFLGCKHALLAMLPAGAGCIINVASRSGLFGVAGHGAHAATKAGVVGLTRQIAVEYGPKGIRCNAIAPSYIDYGEKQPRMRANAVESYPLGRFAQPQDPVNAALFLASDEAAYVNGHLLVVDGGITVRA